MICPSCKTNNVDGAAYCDNCGASLNAPAPGPVGQPLAGVPGGAGGAPCPQCGNLNVAGSMFCENCGTSLSQQSPQPAFPPTPPPPAGGYPPPPPAGGYPPPPPAGGYPPPQSYAVTGRLVLPNGTALQIPPGLSEVMIGREDPVSNIFPQIDLETHDGLNNGV